MADTRQRHNAYQEEAFEKHLAWFRQPIPDDIDQRTARIVAAAQLAPADRVLDVGTGTGVLIPHIQRFGVGGIVGCDLCEGMLAEAERRHPHVQYWQGDVVELPSDFGRFHVVFFNGMFGNVWDQHETLQSISTRLARNGRVVISHPMGATFVEELRRSDPRMVPHALPTETRLADLIEDLPLELERFHDEEQLYLCVLRYAPTTLSRTQTPSSPSR